MSTNMLFSRKLLVSSPSSIWQRSELKLTAEPPLQNSSPHINLDKNFLFIISVIMCGVIISFIMNFIIKYALRCLTSTASEAIASSPSEPSPSQGINKEALEAFPVVTYCTAEGKLPGQDTECVICLSEFVSGDKVRVLPKCSHGFHVVCIDEWLGSHSTCPKCRHCLISICEKIVEGSTQQVAASPEPFLPAQGIPPSCILPVEHETMVRIYRSSC